MMRRTRLAWTAALALVAASAPAAPAAAQTTMTLVCAPGVGCDQIRFGLSTTTSVLINDLSLSLLGTTWRFTPFGGPGVYQAQDSFGPASAFGGFTTVNAGGTLASMNFLDNGFPFQLDAGTPGFLQLEGINADDPTGLVVDYVGTLDTGGKISGRAVFGPAAPGIVPEPGTVALMGTGLLALGVWRRRRR